VYDASVKTLVGSSDPRWSNVVARLFECVVFVFRFLEEGVHDLSVAYFAEINQVLSIV
jgi:hypothetical protein